MDSRREGEWRGESRERGIREWVMSELLQNPDQMKKVKAELAKVIGANKKLQESHIDSLPY